MNKRAAQRIILVDVHGTLTPAQLLLVSLSLLDALNITCNLAAVSVGKCHVCYCLCSQHASEMGSLTLET